MRADLLDAQLQVIGPESVPLSFPRASVMERFAAFVVDTVILYMLVVGLVAFGLVLAGSVGSQAVFGVALALTFISQNAYFPLFEILWQGATPGKKLLHLRVVSRDGAGLDVPSVVARNLMRDVEFLVPMMLLASSSEAIGRSPWWLAIPALAWLGIMVAMPFLSHERTRVGDLVGGTLVVRIPTAELKTDTARTSLAPGSPYPLTQAQLLHYGEAELETLADVLRRIEERRIDDADVAVVAQAIARKIAYRHNVMLDPAAFLHAFYAAQRAHLEQRLLLGKRKASKLDRERGL